MDAQVDTSTECQSGKANYLSLIHDDGKHVLVFSGDAKLQVDQTAHIIKEKFGIPIVPFQIMGNKFIAVPEDRISEEELESATDYYNEDVFSGSPIEAGKQMQSR